MSPVVTQKIDAVPETGSVTAMRFIEPSVNGKVKSVTAFDTVHIEDNVHFGHVSGDLRDLGPHTMAVQVDEAKKTGVKLGDAVTVAFPETGPQALKVGVLYQTKQPVGPYVISMATFDANVTKRVDDVALVSNAPGVSMTQARHAIHGVLDFPTVMLRTRNEFKGSVAGEINQILGLIYVLLGMALVIALFGIANTLALSVFERTREFRAVAGDRDEPVAGAVVDSLGVGVDRVARNDTGHRSGSVSAAC